MAVYTPVRPRDTERTIIETPELPSITLDAKLPTGPIETAWDRRKFEVKLVSPANKRRYNILVVGSGLAGASASASLAELGYNVKCFCYQDSPRRAHSI